jgi:hypothetical protein
LSDATLHANVGILFLRSEKAVTGILSNALDKKVDLLDKIANRCQQEKGLAEANPLIFIAIL